MAIEIKNIVADETYPVRHPVLRTNKPIDTCQFDGDALETTTHFGLFEQNKLVGVVTIMMSKNPVFQHEIQFQMRGMAVLSDFQGKGFGAQLVKSVEKSLESYESAVLWFHARAVAVPFYLKMGFKIIGKPFEIADIGVHHIMFKNLRK